MKIQVTFEAILAEKICNEDIQEWLSHILFGNPISAENPLAKSELKANTYYWSKR